MREKYLKWELPQVKGRKIHWMKGTKIYRLWANMLNAIRNEKAYRYKYIWWIWIKCDEKRIKFEWFYEDVKELYEKAEKEIEWKIFLCRKNIDKDFTKENIFFWTKKDSQDQNRKYVIWDWKKYTQTDLIREVWMSYESAQKIINEQWTKDQFEDYKFNLVHHFEYEWELLTAREIVNKSWLKINPKTLHDRLTLYWLKMDLALSESGKWNRSKFEIEVFNFICANYDWKILHNKKFITEWKHSKEIDIYLPDINLWFEFNWCLFHSTSVSAHKENHNLEKEKREFFNGKWIDIMFIREDQWLNKKDLMKSMILNRLWRYKKTASYKIYARNTNIKSISKFEYCNFCEKNHIQWSESLSNIRYWLFFNWELVSVMWFNKKTNRLNRFCTKIYTNVIWGFSKLLKYYIKENQPKQVVSFADLDIVNSENNIYQNNWFVSEWIELEYFYVLDTTKKDNKIQWRPYRYKRFHKTNFRKGKMHLDQAPYLKKDIK